MEWKRVSLTFDSVDGSTKQQLQRYAVAISNFEPPQGSHSDKYLRLLVGDIVIVEKQCGDWYYGRLLSDSKKDGVFPGNYLKFKDDVRNSYRVNRTSTNGDITTISKSGLDYEEAAINGIYDSSIVHEVSTVLRAWIKCCREAYMARRIDDVLPVVSMMQDVTKWRKQILSGKLPVDEVKILKQKIGRKIDVGNKKLGLDLVVRDRQFETIVTEKYSVLELYNHHVDANERIEQDSRTNVQTPLFGRTTPRQESVPSGVVIRSKHFPVGLHGGSAPNVSTNRSLFVHILDVSYRDCGDAELSLALYDAKEQQFISELFTMTWQKSTESPDEGKRRTSIGSCGHGQRILFDDLGTKDLARDRFYLICRIIRTGSFENTKENVSNHDLTPTSGGSGSLTMNSRKTQVRQFHAIGAMELRGALQITTIPSISNTLKLKHAYEHDQERPWFFPLMQFYDDTLDQALKRVIETRTNLPSDASPGLIGRQMHFSSVEVMGNHSPGTPGVTNKDQGVWLSVQLMVGNAEEAKATYAHVLTSPIAVVRKMGFPEVISSGDFRNDLYLTLVGGDFSHCGRSHLNVEVKVCMVDDKGVIQPNAITIVGPRITYDTYYSSTVRYHEDRPQWGEVIKLAIPVETYSTSHVKFLFRHRPRSESKDKNEKPFALSFMRLMQSNETIIGNRDYELLVYKLDRKYEEQSDSLHAYVSLPSTRTDLERWTQISGNNIKNGPSVAGATLSPKDNFHIRTIICSTSLTQNADLLGLLNWRSKRDDIRQSLEALKKSESDRNGEEIVKFLHNVLDSLFQILMELNDYDQLVFDCLIYVIGLVNEHRYSSFKPILEGYLKSHFCAALAYQKLIITFKDYLDNVEERYETLLSALKSMEYLMKFIVRSKELRMQLKGSVDDFVRLMNQLLQALSDLMRLRSCHSIVVQGAALRYIPHCVSDVAQAYDGRDLAFFLRNTLEGVPEDGPQKEKLWCIQNLIKSEFYKRVEYRRVLQPSLLRIICMDHIEHDNELDICVHVLSDLMMVLYGTESTCHAEQPDLQNILKYALRPIIQVIIRLIEQHFSQDGPMTAPSSRLTNYIALLLAILSKLNEELYDFHVANRFATRTDRIDFLTELLMLFNDLIEKRTFPADWFQMICKRNSIMLEILRFITLTIKKYFLHQFEASVWTICFRTLVAFITQEDLQLEQFPPEKRNEVLCRYGDMRENCALFLASLWRSMNFDEKRIFIPDMVGPFLEVTLLSPQGVRERTIPIFHDMMIADLYQMNVAGFPGAAANRGSERFERELLSQLNTLVEQGHGDFTYVESFEQIMEARRSKAPFSPAVRGLNDMGARLTAKVKRLLTKLLEFREVKQKHDCLDNRMSCTRKLLDFCGTIEHPALYIQYVHKLYELHIDCDNYAEAAFSLKLHADKLKWSDDPVPSNLLCLLPESYRSCITERALKEKLYYEILALLDKGQLWERAMEICHELQDEYEHNSFDYVKLGGLMDKMAKLYRNIMGSGQVRVAPEYYRVAFYGRGFPVFLQDQVFVYRGQPGERQPEFTARMKVQFPEAQEMTVLTPPTQEQLNSTKQLLQINKVDPLCDLELLSKRFKGRKVDSRISWYYKNYENQKFTYTRRIPPPKLGTNERKGAIQDNEFSMMWLERTVIVVSEPFPGVMRWFQVASSSERIVGPLEVAVETIQDATKQLHTVIEDVEHSDGRELKPLQARLQGILQPAVMGGISNYEKTFFTEAYTSQCGPDDLSFIAQLKDLIAAQIPLLEKGLYLHARYCPDEQIPFHQMLLDSFKPYKLLVEEKYGKKASIIPINGSLIPLRQQHQPRSLQKHMSVDGVGTSSSTSDLTLKKQGAKDCVMGHTTWGLRHGISAIGMSGMSTVPRRHPTSSTFVKRKASQGIDLNGRDTIRERHSNTSGGSTLSMELLENESGPVGTSTPIGNATIVNGILTVTENVTPQRPPRPQRPPSGISTAISMRNESRSGSLHSLLNAPNHNNTTPAHLDSMSDSTRAYDKVSAPLKCHSFDSLQDGEISPEPPPQLPPRRPSLALANSNRQQPSGINTIARHVSTSGRTLGQEDIREEDESATVAANPEINFRIMSQHSFVIPRRPKPLPPRPVEKDNDSAL